MTTTLLLIHATATLAMCGVIWIVQRVHYPLMTYADASRFGEFERAHQRRIGSVVLPLMVIEAASAALILALGVAHVALSTAGIAILVVLWLSTFLVQVPLHRRLEQGLSPSTIAQLVRTNWIRTILWTVRGGLALMMLAAQSASPVPP